MTNGPQGLPGRQGEEPEDLPDVHITGRTKVCLWIIVLGLANFLVYTVTYFVLPGEAIHGGIRMGESAGEPRHHYYLLHKGGRVEVTRGVWIYSAAHSATIPVTVAAVLLAMLTLAKDRIVSSMRRSLVRGRALITLLALAVGVLSVVWMIRFLHVIINYLHEPPPLVSP
jgi:hypothetical protein